MISGGQEDPKRHMGADVAFGAQTPSEAAESRAATLASLLGASQPAPPQAKSAQRRNLGDGATSSGQIGSGFSRNTTSDTGRRNIGESWREHAAESGRTTTEGFRGIGETTSGRRAGEGLTQYQARIAKNEAALEKLRRGQIEQEDEQRRKLVITTLGLGFAGYGNVGIAWYYDPDIAATGFRIGTAIIDNSTNGAKTWIKIDLNAPSNAVSYEDTGPGASPSEEEIVWRYVAHISGPFFVDRTG